LWFLHFWFATAVQMASGIRNVRDCCAIFGCSSQSFSVDAGQQKSTANMAFFSFPPEKDKNRRKLWIRVCRRDDPINPMRHKICERHFSADCILTTTASGAPRKFKILTSDAVPTEFLPSSGGLVKPANKRTPKERSSAETLNSQPVFSDSSGMDYVASKIDM
jgi:hypothetical protein